MTIDAATPPPAPGPARGEVVTSHEICARCEYVLRGLPLDGACPECGASVRGSVRGDLLADADPSYVRRMRLATGLIAWGAGGIVAIWITLLLFSFLMTTMAFAPGASRAGHRGMDAIAIALGVGVIAAWCVMIAGEVVLTAREAAPPAPNTAPGRGGILLGLLLLGVAIALGLVTYPVQQTLNRTAQAVNLSLGSMSLLASLIGFAGHIAIGVGSTRQAQRLAERIPEKRLVMRFRRLRRYFIALGVALP